MDVIELELLRPFFALASFVLGGLIGSFLNVCVYRIPRGLSVVKPRSVCPKCGKSIAWYDNVPIFSWLLLQAKCRNCDEPISWQYPLVEGITAVLFLLVFLQFDFTLATAVYMLVAASLVMVTFVDLTDWTIPDEVTYPGIVLGVACAILASFYDASGLRLDSITSSIAGLVVGGGMLWGLDLFALAVFKKPGMGFGDVKLMAMLGAFFGFANTILIITLAAFIGCALGVPMLIRERLKGGEPGSGFYMPFGPFICVAGIIAMLRGPELISMYLRYMGVEVV